MTRGLDLPLAGAPVQEVEPGPPVAHVAVLAADHPGAKLRPLVEEGARVALGQPVLEHAAAGLRLPAPGSGTVTAIHRGERRALRSVVVALDPDADDRATFASFTGRRADALTAEAIRALLLESGLWTAFRTRPFSKVPRPDAVPDAIFVTAIDTQPHAPAVEAALAGREDDFAAGLAVVARLAARTYLCRAAGSRVAAPAGSGIGVEEFAGPHPAGTPGLHIHVLEPVDAQRTVWHVGYQDVAAIGRLFAAGVLDVTRVVALGGPMAARPRLLRTRTGASLEDLTRGELKGPARVVSGSVLSGRAASDAADAFLGRYHLQVSALGEGRAREFFGWIAPGAEKFSVTGTVLGAFRRGHRFALTTTTNGSARAMVPIGTYERVMPFDILPTLLLRALITGDDARAEALGCLELDEEDLALCTYVCPGKYDYGPLLRAALDRLAKEAA